MDKRHVERAISLPFSIDSYGNVASTKDQSKIWADKVRSVIGTALEERVMRATFGTSIPLATFDGQQLVAEITRKEVSNSFAKFLPALTLNDVLITITEEEQIIADVIYSTPNQQEITTSIGVASISGNAPIYEEFA